VDQMNQFKQLNHIKPYLSWVGGVFVGYGILSILLWFTPFEVRAISWINMWGVVVSWVFRIAFIVGGAVLFFIFKKE